VRPDRQHCNRERRLSRKTSGCAADTGYRNVWDTIKRLGLGLALIVAASAVLLLSDSSRRTTPTASLPRVAIVQHVSQTIIDEGVQGMIDGLRARGFVDGSTVQIRRYNAEGDIATANAIAKEVTGSDFDLLVTATTLSLQSVATANRATRINHVFALVSDPPGAGVGISREDPLEHPPYLAGYGTMQPVEATLKLALQSFPGLRTLGTVWNPAEANSEANVVIARVVAKRLGIDLIEANAESSAAVGEAASSLTSRGVDAIWIGGDVTAITAMSSVVSAARRARIPVFTSIPGSVDSGALFDVGADYHEVGRLAGDLAGRILQGTSPATIAIENVMPETVLVNRDALAGLQAPWSAPAPVAAAASPPTPAAPSKTWKIDVLEYVSVEDSEQALRGVRDGIANAGLVDGRDYTLRVRNAQGDMPTLPALADAAITEGTDLIVTLSTPTLQATLQRARNVPIVFTFSANPIGAGAGRSNDDHLPNVTGVPTIGAYEELLDVVRECLPSAVRLGTLFVPAEINSVYNREMTEKAAAARGMKLIALPVNTSTEIADAALSLAARDIDAIVQLGSNLTTVAFASIAQAADRARLPLFGALSGNSGAAVVVARDYYDGGVRTGGIVARVVRGESPAAIPFEPETSTHLLIDPAAAARQGLTIPASIAGRATVIAENEPARGGD